MTLDELYNFCLHHQQVLASKGYFRCDVEFHLNWIGRHYCVGVEFRTDADVYDSRVYKSFHHETDLMAVLTQVTDYVHSIKSRDEIAREKFLERLAHLVEDADKLGIEIPALRPCFEEYRNNLLTYQPETVQ